MYIIHPSQTYCKKLLRQFEDWGACFGSELNAYNYKNILSIPAIEINGRFIHIVDSDIEIPDTPIHFFINEADMMNWQITVQRIGTFIRGRKPKNHRSKLQIPEINHEQNSKRDKTATSDSQQALQLGATMDKKRRSML